MIEIAVFLLAATTALLVWVAARYEGMLHRAESAKGAYMDFFMTLRDRGAGYTYRHVAIHYPEQMDEILRMDEHYRSYRCGSEKAGATAPAGTSRGALPRGHGREW